MSLLEMHQSHEIHKREAVERQQKAQRQQMLNDARKMNEDSRDTMRDTLIRLLDHLR